VIIREISCATVAVFHSIFTQRRATGYTKLQTTDLHISVKSLGTNTTTKADCVAIDSDGELGVAQWVLAE
jgi:hypothetical protein